MCRRDVMVMPRRHHLQPRARCGNCPGRCWEHLRRPDQGQVGPEEVRRRRPHSTDPDVFFAALTGVPTALACPTAPVKDSPHRQVPRD
ncbi:hypothetical protein HMPREF9056_00470 [Actinomyces sp. oral taxon 170 str. F0386]|nr:hypothetical protein HMPREF9056_00470 [Actinomyces sp. oral taxon 170 str. F0386]